MRRPRHAAEPAGHAEAEQIGILPPLNVRVVGPPAPAEAVHCPCQPAEPHRDAAFLTA